MKDRDLIRVPKGCAFAFENLLNANVTFLSKECDKIYWIGRAAKETGLGKLYVGKEENVLIRSKPFTKVKTTRKYVLFKVTTLFMLLCINT